MLLAQVEPLLPAAAQMLSLGPDCGEELGSPISWVKEGRREGRLCSFFQVRTATGGGKNKS